MQIRNDLACAVREHGRQTEPPRSTFQTAMPRGRERTSGASDDCSGLPEHRVEHRAGQLARERILLARMVGADQRYAPRQAIQDTVPEPQGRLRKLMPQFTAGLQIVIERDLSQRHYHFDLPE